MTVALVFVSLLSYITHHEQYCCECARSGVVVYVVYILGKKHSVILEKDLGLKPKTTP